jgi:hypothetical protein
VDFTYDFLSFYANAHVVSTKFTYSDRPPTRTEELDLMIPHRQRPFLPRQFAPREVGLERSLSSFGLDSDIWCDGVLFTT